LGQTAMELLQSPQPPELSTILTTLLNELASHQAPPAPLVLMVDDYHVIDEPAIHEGMSFFLEHLPAKVHLILSSRVDPDLRLSPRPRATFYCTVPSSRAWTLPRARPSPPHRPERSVSRCWNGWSKPTSLWCPWTKSGAAIGCMSSFAKPCWLVYTPATRNWC